MIEAIETSDPSRMENITSEHFRNTEETLDIYYERYPAFFEKRV